MCNKAWYFSIYVENALKCIAGAYLKLFQGGIVCFLGVYKQIKSCKILTVSLH